MHPSFIKAKVFAALALIILTVGFTFPMITFHGTMNQIAEEKIDEISPFSVKVCNLYNQGRYKSIATD